MNTWTVEKQKLSGYWETAIIDERDGCRIAVVADRGGSTPDGARLIAAAPDLLAALEYIVGWRPTGWSAETARDMARAALDRARGLDSPKRVQEMGT